MMMKSCAVHDMILGRTHCALQWQISMWQKTVYPLDKQVVSRTSQTSSSWLSALLVLRPAAAAAAAAGPASKTGKDSKPDWEISCEEGRRGAAAALSPVYYYLRGHRRLLY